ncbi:trehalose corynomycolyl transferase B [Corynebacterium diphtheriae HC01]|uniref:alpha/beta hydrolase n=1 Tax=Corynebacterium diphtheriae TaxID=1717 RepID=UPI000245B1D4|nr:alpha/beta hydrolase family protein [Corynebacterium diphtheriae]AEX45135.1 trehalose corynomycolyl transferase B [Corynebacterium diphtheriae 241]AEX75325.1 trehalose corynomycolyl transferase B [Corynebacterium diphtheriae HC01]AEX77565.1 trehalose corynomycolyl transferase B [Corynebacterium diphtheriae HC02]AEX79805.1 trehalose corynomycolyl transferase B [Corynebacterium diphtheriae HC03]AEX82099.1 trehalose corynomycolyl transferase B [Corynebacterium diphtheriae HC04]
MTIVSRLKQASTKAVATVASLATVAAILVSGAGTATAANRDFLRGDATGTCEWDGVAHWVQRCDVFSPAMGRNITVQIQPAQRGGNAALYLLDGARANEIANAWTTDAHVQDLFVDHNITLVMPVGGAGSFYTDWVGPAGPQNAIYRWETFLTQELPGYLAANFGVSPTNNSIAGLSMGATAAMNLAALHPDQFRQVLSYSGYLSMSVPGTYLMMTLALQEVGGFNINNMYGSFFGLRRFQLDPLVNAAGLAGKDVYVSAASGIWGGPDYSYAVNDRINGSILEIASRVSTRIWEAQARAIGLNLTTNYPLLGVHNWVQWRYQIEQSKPRILDVMNAW